MNRRSRPTHWWRRPRGLALIHMVVATGILSLLLVGAGLFALYSSADISGENKWRTTVNQLYVLHEMVEDHRVHQGEAPETIEEVTGGCTPLDPWGNPYVYERRGQTAYTIYSLGSDGLDGTIEDVHLNRSLR